MVLKALSILTLTFVMAQSSWACDPCSLYNASRLQGHSTGAWTFSVSEQYTDFQRAAGIKDNSIRDGELVKGFSTTQFSLSYDLTENAGLQFTLPVIGRSFDTIDHYRSEGDSDAGIGDVSLIGSYSFLNYRDEDWALIGGFLGGLKAPTGDTGVLKNVSTNDGDLEETEGLILKHHQIGTASGGRALAFGSGSYDGIFGLYSLARYERYVFLSSVQYTAKTEGDFQYRFADDLLWSVGPAYYFLLDHHSSFAAGVSLSGEFKGRDHLRGEVVKGSQISNIYLGPEFLFTLNEHLGGSVTFDTRVTDEDEDSTVVPNTRIRASLSYRFS